MSVQRFVWQKDSLDAVSIWVPGGKLVIEGVEGDQVVLEGELVNRFAGMYRPDPAERWLQLHLGERPTDDTPFVLRMPVDKAWVVDLYAWWGQVEVRDVRGRVHVKLQKGDLRAMNCRGTLHLATVDGKVEVHRCVEDDLPEPPPLPRWQFGSPDDPMNAEWMKIRPSSNWFSWGEEEWSGWGMMLGEQARAWGEQFAQFFDPAGMKSYRKGINVRLTRGNAYLEEVEAGDCTVKLANGSAKLERGRIGRLDMHTARGDLECKSVFPAGNWAIKTSHGNVRLSLPPDTNARLNAATRHGEIRSDVPLVRVGRPGPEARNGGRMVGSLGSTEGTAPELNLVTLHGDVRIEVRPTDYRPVEPQPAQTAAPEEVIVTPPPAVEAVPGVEPVQAATVPAPSGNPPTDPQLAILQALSEGSISIEEAERLLDSLGDNK